MSTRIGNNTIWNNGESYIDTCEICEKQMNCIKREIKWTVVPRGKYKALYGEEDYESSIEINICKRCNNKHKHIETCGWDKWDALDNIDVKEYDFGDVVNNKTDDIYTKSVYAFIKKNK